MNPAFGYSYTNLSRSKLNTQNQLVVNHPMERSEREVVGCNAPSKPAQIHINPKMCAPRNIYINKAFTNSSNNTTVTKPERVYYNPKFLKNNTKLPLKSQEVTALESNISKKEPNIYINPNFIKKEIKTANNTANSRPNETEISSWDGIHVNPVFLKNISCNNKTESITTVPTQSLAKRLNPVIPSTSNITSKPKFVSKYKLVRKKTNPITSNNLSYSRKSRTSRYKKINLLPVKKKKIKIVKGKFLMYINQNMSYHRKSKVPVLSEFKSIGRNKLVRKSVLQKQIESRMCAKKYSKITPTLATQKVSSPRKSEYKISKYKMIRSTNQSTNKQSTIKKQQISNKVVNAKKKPVRRRKSSLVFSSAKYRSDKRNRVAAFTKKLRKNNQPCPFYNRYGHCKGKDKGTCQRLHDPKYIAICKRFVKGECTDDKCTLSHDIRPEKMPTCHHYLAGICKKTDCPYLHIKVNPKAPICRAFLQGFCADVFNCTKRHEYLCPVFAEKGSCPRERTCPYAHRSPMTLTKLLQPDEFPLINRKKVSIPKKTLSRPPPSSKQKEFKRYFLEPLSDAENESPDDDDDDNEDS